MRGNPSNFKWTAGSSRTIQHEKLIASGGYGDVHLMRDSKTCEVFARKLIRLGTVTEEEIANEAKVIDKLCNGANPWMVKVLKHGNLTGNSLFYYIDMEYCPETLEQRIETMREHAFIKNSTHGLTTDSSRIDWDQFSKVFPMVLDIIKGIQYIHSQGLVHRDLKPRNILFCKSAFQNNGCWKITDFGITSAATSRRMVTTQFSRGTASYRAPELLKEEAEFNNKSDIWAFGCIFYEISTCVKLFRHDHSVFHYSTTKELNCPVRWPVSEELIYIAPVQEFINLHTETLRLDPSERPSAGMILSVLFSLYGYQWPGRRFRYFPGL